MPFICPLFAYQIYTQDSCYPPSPSLRPPSLARPRCAHCVAPALLAPAFAALIAPAFAAPIAPALVALIAPALVALIVPALATLIVPALATLITPALVAPIAPAFARTRRPRYRQPLGVVGAVTASRFRRAFPVSRPLCCTRTLALLRPPPPYSTRVHLPARLLRSR
ncbi:hypothetical protein C8R47DRAFT_1210366 [Mycena vitilis]|nr:hypothetical protein C8R47DRAFT_1210366 [Mycena vitilis]